jgi:hypothetical protein
MLLLDIHQRPSSVARHRSPGFGVVSSAWPARQIQAGARLVF